MFLYKHMSGILELCETSLFEDPDAEVVEVPDDFTFDPDYFYDIVDGKPAKFLRPKIEEESKEA